MEVNPRAQYSRFLSRSGLSVAGAMVVLCLAGGCGFVLADTEEEEGESAGQENFPATVEEARGRARWIHEGFHGTLQVMHRDFFDDEETRNIPSASLEDVFAEMERSWSVEMRWLGVNATKDVDHEPQDQFEEDAAAALKAGEPEYEAMEEGRYRFVGAIKLQNECLKCHVPNRTSLEDRVAGFAISMPLKMPTETN